MWKHLGLFCFSEGFVLRTTKSNVAFVGRTFVSKQSFFLCFDLRWTKTSSCRTGSPARTGVPTSAAALHIYASAQAHRQAGGGGVRTDGGRQAMHAGVVGRLRPDDTPTNRATRQITRQRAHSRAWTRHRSITHTHRRLAFTATQPTPHLSSESSQPMRGGSFWLVKVTDLEEQFHRQKSGKTPLQQVSFVSF